MARVQLPEDDQQDPNAQPVDPNGGATVGAPAPQRSRFNDISRLLYANQGQGQRVAQNAIQGTQHLADAATSQLGAAQNAYSSAAQAGSAGAYTPTAPAPISRGASGLVAGARPTTAVNLDSGSQLANATAALGATYKGPNSLEETPGVDASRLAQSFDQARQSANTLAINPSHRTGGAGKFDDFLAQHEAGGDLKAAQKRFGGLRSQLTAAQGNTSAADAGRARVAAGNTAAQGVVDTNNAAVARETQQAADATNAADAAAQDDEGAYQNFLAHPNINLMNIPGFNGFNHTINGVPIRDWYLAQRHALPILPPHVSQR